MIQLLARRCKTGSFVILEIPFFLSVKCNSGKTPIHIKKILLISKNYVNSMNAHKPFHYGINYVNAANRYPSKTDETQTDILSKPTRRKPISKNR